VLIDTQQIVSVPVEEKVIEPPEPLVESESKGAELPSSGVVKRVEIRDVASLPDSPVSDVPSTSVPSIKMAQGIVDGILSPSVSPLRQSMGEKTAVFDLQTLPGIGAKIAEQLKADGIDSKEKVLALGVDGLQRYQGISESRAQVIIEALGE
jgi:predicted flap endonuclease-1-like 5' DNA nuclease